MKRLVTLFLVATLLVGCGTSSKVTTTDEKKVEKVEFTDSLGRKVEIPKKLTKIAPSGMMAQVVLASFAPEKMVCIARKPSDKVSSMIKDFPKDKPEVGQFYGKKPNFNKEELIKADPEVVIDIGEVKKNMKEDLDQIEKNTGVPTIFIELTPKKAKDAYKTLGELLDKKERADKISNFFEKEVKVIEDGLKKIPENKRLTFIQVGGKNGMAIDPAKSSHTEAVEFAGGINVAAEKKKGDKSKKEDKKSKTENINIEEVVKKNPNVIFVKDKNTLEDIKKDEKWQVLDAVKNGKLYLVPQDPYNFVDAPPSVNKMIGIYWAANKMYPDVFNYNIDNLVKEFKSVVLNIN